MIDPGKGADKRSLAFWVILLVCVQVMLIAAV